MKLMVLLPYAPIATGLFPSLATFMTLKRREIRGLAFRQNTRIDEMMARLDEAARPLEAVAEETAVTSGPRPCALD
jgi:hypothetical protein